MHKRQRLVDGCMMIDKGVFVNVFPSIVHLADILTGSG